jgi:DNA-binding IclR family transcriptional regulator
MLARPRPLVKRAEVQAIEALTRWYPGATTSLLARLSGLSRTAVDHCLAELVEWGDRNHLVRPTRRLAVTAAGLGKMAGLRFVCDTPAACRGER